MASIIYNDDDIKAMINTIKFMRHVDNKLHFEIGNQQFNISVPQEKDGLHLLDLPITLDGYSWLGRVNEFVFDKQPTLQRLLQHIENKYEIEKKKLTEKKAVRQDLFDIPELKVDRFDIEEQKYRKTLEGKMDKQKSNLSLTTDSNKTPALFSGKTPGLVILNEFFNMRKRFSTDQRLEITLVNDNVYQWNIKFRYFQNEQLNKQLKELKSKYGYDYIELEIHFHDKLYPGYPPFIRSVRPRLENSLMNRITNMKMVQLEYWTPSRDMGFIINKLLTCLDKCGSVDHDSEMNNIKKYPTGAYHSLESILIKLASLCDIKDSYEPLDTEEYKKIMNVEKSSTTKSTAKPSSRYASSSNTVFKKGTGYGHDGNNNWDPNEYIRLQQEKDHQIQSVINTIIDNLNTFSNAELPMVYKILGSSYIIPFIKSYIKGTNILDMSKHVDMYKLLFTFLQMLSTEDSIFLFTDQNSDGTLYDILGSLYKEAKQVINISGAGGNDGDADNDIPLMVCTVYEMVKPIYDSYVETRKKYIEEEKQKWAKKVEDAKSNVNPEHTKYKELMGPLNFDTCQFTSPFYQFTKSDKSSTINKVTIKRLAREYAALTNSLPIFFESSIFVRVDSQDSRKVKVLITGPDGTPYDSGCLIFDVYTGNDYPTGKPQMNFKNHGGKRFNPNLYNCGKVCLSLLGTWSGGAGESWNPDTSTLQQLFISVQSQILVPDPFYNEPGYESRYNSPEGREQSRQYSNERRWYTMVHAMYDLLANPNAYPEFTDVIQNHFRLKKNYIKQLCDKWVAEPKNNFEKQTIEIASKVKALLDKLN